ncbi:MAG: hypothetical protein ABEJ68_01840 [Halobacteriaceae archaeon]
MSDERGWKFELEDLEEDEESTGLERESVSVENALFVAAGVVLTAGSIVVMAL